MARTSCISHPEGERLVLIRKWQLEACGKDACAAALLNLFEYWHNIKLEQTSQTKSYNEIAHRHGENGAQIETLLQWHTSEQLENSLLNIFNKRRIHAGVEVLENLKFISVHRNPNPRYSFDKKKHFLFHPDAVRIWLKSYTLKNTGFKSGENEPVTDDLSRGQNETIDSDDLRQSISENCYDDNHINTFPSVTIDPLIKANFIEQYTENTYQDHLSKLPTEKHMRSTGTNEKRSVSVFGIFWDKWAALTRKPVNKNKALGIFSNLVRNENDPLLSTILEALENQTREKELRQKLNLFVPQWPNPSSWLSEARWEDEVFLDEEFYKAELLRSSSGLTQNKQTIRQQREYYLDGQYKSRISGIQNEQSNPIVDRQSAIRQFDEEFRNRKRNL